jgi:hypothetical protein
MYTSWLVCHDAGLCCTSLPGRHPTKNLASTSQARKHKMVFVTFGNLAIIVSQGDVRPMALRRRLSPVLPFSDVSAAFIALNFVMMPYSQFSIKRRPDSAFTKGLNVSDTFTGRIANREIIGKTNDELVTRWNNDHPDDQLSFSAN